MASQNDEDVNSREQMQLKSSMVENMNNADSNQGIPIKPQEPFVPESIPWLRQLFSWPSLVYYSRLIVWVFILLLLVDAFTFSSIAELSSLRSIWMFIALMLVLLYLKLNHLKAYMNFCW